MTAMTTAMTEAYFRPGGAPVSDMLRTGLYSYVLACPIDASPWIWNAGLGMLTHRHTGVAKPRTTFKPKPVEPYFDVRSINAEVAVSDHDRSWKETEFDMGHPTVADTKPVPPEDDRMVDRIGDHKVWHERQEPLKRAEQKRRAKRYHPAQRNVVPRDYMTSEDREAFYWQARKIMSDLAALSLALPMCKIMATKMAVSLLEAVEWRQIGVTEWGQGLTKRIEEELRSYGAPHGVKRADGSDDLSVDKLEWQREGARFQYHYCQLLFQAWKDQLVDVELEYGGLMQSTNFHSNTRSAIEHAGKIDRPTLDGKGRTTEYIPVLLRQHEKKKRALDVEMRSAVHRAELVGKTPEAFAAYYEKHTGMKPRKGGAYHGQAMPEVAQPMSESEASWMDDEAGYTFDDDGNVVD